MTTVPNSAAMIEPSFNPAASGISAKMVAKAVIRMWPHPGPPTFYERFTSGVTFSP